MQERRDAEAVEPPPLEPLPEADGGGEVGDDLGVSGRAAVAAVDGVSEGDGERPLLRIDGVGRVVDRVEPRLVRDDRQPLPLRLVQGEVGLANELLPVLHAARLGDADAQGANAA